MRWPLLTIAAGLIVMHLGGWFGARITARWKRSHPTVADPFRDELGAAFVRENPAAWLLPVLSFAGLGLIAGGLLWLALASAF